jgi:hypothetical protein
MSSPIDPIRRAVRLRRAQRAEAGRAEEAVQGTGLPVPVEPARTVPPPAAPATGAAAFDAQLLGQDGQKRGLRAGPQAIDVAKASYNRVEWSGAKDRRARKGRYKTEA